MEYEKIKQLMDDMSDSKLTTIQIEFPDGTKINMEKASKVEYKAIDAKIQNEITKEVENIPQDLKESLKEDKVNDNKDNNELSGNIVTSPMVGTFYLKPSPTAEQFVQVGKEIKQGDTLCIIEAMKLMNEIESEYTGKVLEILVKDGEPVEYGTPLFRIGE